MNNTDSHDITRARILVVDQDPLVAKLLSRLLPTRRFQVLNTVAEPVRAMAAITRHQPHLVLLDAHLKESAALRLLGALRKQVPAIGCLVTAHRFDALEMASMLEQGADGYVVKPFDASLLAEVERVTTRCLVQRAAHCISMFKAPKTEEILRSFHDEAEPAPHLAANSPVFELCAAQ